MANRVYEIEQKKKGQQKADIIDLLDDLSLDSSIKKTGQNENFIHQNSNESDDWFKPVTD